MRLTLVRYHARPSPGNRLSLSAPFATELDRARLQSGLQRPRLASVRCVAFRDSAAFPEWYVFHLGQASLLTLAAHIPLFLYPFLNTTSKTRPFEYLRLTSLGVIGALVKVCFRSFPSST